MKAVASTRLFLLLAVLEERTDQRMDQPEEPHHSCPIIPYHGLEYRLLALLIAQASNLDNLGCFNTKRIVVIELLYCVIAWYKYIITKGRGTWSIGRCTVLQRGQRKVPFPCSADHEQDWQPCPVHTYSATMYAWASHVAEYGSTG